jgi:hypothetical protein
MKWSTSENNGRKHTQPSHGRQIFQEEPPKTAIWQPHLSPQNECRAVTIGLHHGVCFVGPFPAFAHSSVPRISREIWSDLC